MFKRFLLSLLAVGAVSLTWASTPSQLRVYLNPGHGGWGPNDRPMATIPYPNLSATSRPDTCGFYESNTDLWKVARLRKALIDMGMKEDNITMSRWNNGPYPYDNITYHSGIHNYNRSLSEIAAEVEAGNYDFFLSVHSNADSDGSSANFPIFLYRGTTGAGGDYATGSRDIALAMWPYNWMDEVDYKSGRSKTNAYVVGDISFMGSSSTVNGYTGYYGVLKHGVPGFISEGFFHTYHPARHRALNEDYCAQEGVRLARGMCAYFGLNPETTGYIMGTVKDKSQSLSHTYYQGAKGDDVYMPVNGAMVTLYKGNDFVASYKVDQNYNGIYVFENLTPGSDYYISVKAAGYANLERSGPYTVVANETAYQRLYLSAGTANNQGMADLVLSFANDYSDVTIAELTDKTVRRALYSNDGIIVLAVESNARHTPHIYLIDPDNATVTREISTDGIVAASNGSVLYDIADIALTDDGKLIAANLEETVYNTTAGTFRVYKWDDLDATPSQWFTSPDSELKSGSWYNALTSRSIAYNGTSLNGYLLTGAVTTGESKQIRFVTYAIDNGNLNGGKITTNYDLDITANRALQSETAYGGDWQLLPSPRRIDQFIVDGSLIVPQEIRLNTGNRLAHKVMGSLPSDNVLPIGGHTFRLGAHSLYVVPQSSGNNIASLALYDITSGVASAETVAISGIDADAATCTYAATLGHYDGNNTALWLLRDNKLSRWTTTNVVPPEPVGNEIGTYAYNLTCTQDKNGNTTFSFTANNDAVSGVISFADATTGEALGSINLDMLNESTGVAQGQNIVTIANNDLPFEAGTVATWAVTLTGRDITAIARLNGLPDNNQYAYNRATVAVDDNPESDYFGRIYVGNWVSRAHADNGLFAYNPDWTRINSTPYTGGETFINNLRFDVASDGTIFFTDWGDAHSGVYRFNPADLSAPAQQLFTGTRNADGLFVNTTGQSVGGSLSAAKVVGCGADTRLYTFDEDYTGTGAYAINSYLIGNDYGYNGASWSGTPTTSFTTTSPNIVNKGDLAVTADGGIWAAVFRSSNLEAYPPLLHFNAEGIVDFSGHGLIDGCHDGAIAISPDESRLAVNDQNGVTHIFAIGKDSNNKPTLTPLYTFTADALTSDNYAYGLAFDWGGNLLVSGSNLGIYALPTTDNRHTTPAKRTMTVTRINPTPTVKRGDVNADGTIDVLDVSITTDVVLGKIGTDSYGRRHDIDNDGYTNVVDISMLVGMILQN